MTIKLQVMSRIEQGSITNKKLIRDKFKEKLILLRGKQIF